MATSLEIWFDLRVPSWTERKTSLTYMAAIDMCQWADKLGFQAVTFGEHHATGDQYVTSPVVAAAAAAGRTRRLQLRMILLSPFYNPIRLAEDLATLSLISNGRAIPVIGSGYRPKEFDMYGIRREDRDNVIEETISVLRQAWSGTPFHYRGRYIDSFSPIPDKLPRIQAAASFTKAAVKAARIADGLSPNQPELYAPFLAELERLGKPSPGPYPNRGTEFLFIAEDPDRAWEILAPHWLHSARSYSQWAKEAGKTVNPRFPLATTKEELQANPAYKVLTPEACVEYAHSLGDDGQLIFQAMPGGLHPEIAWTSLKLFEEKVLPHLSVKFSADLYY